MAVLLAVQMVERLVDQMVDHLDLKLVDLMVVQKVENLVHY